jgi:hypothetical protein
MMKWTREEDPTKKFIKKKEIYHMIIASTR